MASAKEIEDKLENVSILSDCFEEDDDMWDDENNENEPPPPSHGGDGSKRGTAMAPSLDPIREESRMSSASTDYGRKSFRGYDELTERTQARTPIDNSPARELSIEYKDEPFEPISNLSAELRREQESVYQKNRFMLPDDERRSWEGKSHDTDAMGSLLLPKSGQSSFNNDKSGRSSQSKNGSRSSKIVTSTPKGQGRADHLQNSFEDCPLSTIQSNSPISKMSLGSFIGFGDSESHTGSTLSHSKIGNAIKDIQLADDSIDAATQLVSNTQMRSKDFKSSRPMNISKAELSRMSDFQIYQATGMVPKRSYRKKKEITVDPRLAEMTRTLDALETQSLRNSIPRLSSSSRPSSAREPSNASSRPDKTYPVDRPMSVRERTPTPTDPSSLIAVKPFPLSHFGFVAVNEHIILSVTVTNLSKDSIQVQAELKEGVFTLLEKAAVIINGNEQFSFPVKFTPDQRARYKANLLLKVKSSDKTIVHGLLGFGGAANLKVFTNKALRMCPSLSYVMFPSSPTNFTFDVANDGERAGFVIVQAVDDESNVIPGISVTPDRFLMLTNENAKSYKEKWEQSVTVTVRPEALRSLHDRARSSHGRLSTLSRASGSTSERSSLNNSAHLFNLKMVWGDERFRQRAKKHIQQSGTAHPIVHGIPITKLTFINNEEETMLKNTDGFLTAQDVETFQAQICVTTIRVGNQRPLQGSLDRLSSRPSSAASNQSVPEGFYIPTLHDDGLNESRISIAPSTDRTVMPSSKTKRY
uniref:Calponin-homology (CH) domain-containing protein n=1 Tax=Panagrellus redivivus TaxID=6233 RepID=A0A7E4VTB8_PANRE